MKSTANVLPVAAIGISLAAHLLFVLLVPYRAAHLAAAPAHELIPVRLLAAPAAGSSRVARPAAPAVAAPLEKTRAAEATPAPSKPVERHSPVVELPQPSEAPPPRNAEAVTQSAGTATVAEGGPAGPSIPSSATGAGATGPTGTAEASTIAAYQEILSTLRTRILERISYPPIARAEGWEGTVVVAVRLDAEGRLEQTIVRQSSGHEILDRAAAALLKKTTPVANPLKLPVTIEIPIVFALK